MPGWKPTILLLILLAWAAPGKSANVRFDRLTISDGLSQSTVMSVAQDSRGFMWFGTQDGLNRYDGQHFLILRADESDPSSLPANTIHALATGKAGSLWVGTEGGGLADLDVFSNRTRVFRHEPADPASLAENWVTALARDGRGQIWVGLKSAGVDLYLPENARFRHFVPPPASGCSAEVSSLGVQGEAAVLVGTRHGLCRLDTEAGAWQPVALKGARGPLQILAIAPDGNGAVWVGTDQGLFVIGGDGSQRHFVHDPAHPGQGLSNDEVHALLVDSRGNVWIGTQHGLDRYLPQTGSFRHFRTTPGDPKSISDDNIGSLMEDASGLIWIGTLSNGVSKFNPRHEVFQSISTSATPGAGLSDAVVWSVVQNDQGDLWIGTESGLNRYDPATGKVRQFRHEDSDPASLANDNVRDLLVDGQGRLWLATRGGGLDRYDPARHGFDHFRHADADPDSLASDDLLTLVADGDRGLWIGTAGAGLEHLSFATGKFRHFPPQPADPNRLPQGDVYTIEPDGAGGYWLGTLTGLSHFDPATGRFRTYTHHAGDPHSLSNNGVGIVVRADDGTLWIGTDMGLNHFHPHSGRFDVYTTANGLPNNFIYGIVPDHDRIWISTNRGLSSLDLAANKFTNYSTRDGLSSDEFNTGACYRDTSGNIYFGSVNGLDYFDPRAIKPNLHVPPVAITEFKVFDHVLAIGESLRAGRPVHLSYRDNFFSIQFAALDYAAPQANRYAYQMEGLDDTLIQNDHRDYVAFTHLDGGSYRLRVIASNNDGVWNDTGTSIPIIVDSPPWETWWAYAIYAVLGALLLTVLARYNTRRNTRATIMKLHALGQTFNQSLDTDAILARYLTALQDFIPFRSGRAFVPAGAEFQQRAGIPEGDADSRPSALEVRILAAARDQRDTVGVRDAVTAELCQVTDANINEMCMLGIPLVIEDKAEGILLLSAPHAGVFTSERRQLGRTLRTQATTALQNALLYDEIRRHAITDELTGLANRRQFFDRGEREVRRAERYGRELSLLMMDLDHFKQVNDTCGHVAGDAVLRCLGEILRAVLRETDLAARYGGEEFAVLLPETDLEGALRAAQRLTTRFAQAVKDDKDLPTVTISIGVAASNQIGLTTFDTLITAADSALYAAKERGRNSTVAYAASVRAPALPD